MRRTIHENDIRVYILNEYHLEEKTVFEKVPKAYREKILNDVFQHFTGHRLHYRRGLENMKNKDLFDNYRSFDHLEDYAGLSFDLNYTKKQSRDVIARAKRQLHTVRKDRFEARKRRAVNQLTQKEYKLKWKPKSKETELRLKRLQAIKEKEQSKQYER